MLVALMCSLHLNEFLKVPTKNTLFEFEVIFTLSFFVYAKRMNQKKIGRLVLKFEILFIYRPPLQGQSSTLVEQLSWASTNTAMNNSCNIAEKYADTEIRG